MTLLMNPHTGSIDTEENWKADYNARCPEELDLIDLTWAEWSCDLVEVDENGEEIK